MTSGEGRLHAGGRHIGDALFTVDEQVALAAQRILRHAEQLRDHVHRHDAGQVGHEVEVALGQSRLQVGARS